MAYLDWNDSYSVKINDFDVQHMKLIDYINDLHLAMTQGKSKEIMGDLLNKLSQYTIEHFSSEEKLMIKYNFPGYIEHKKQHSDFIEKVSQAQKSFKEGKFLISIDIMNFLKSWLVSHIMGIDKNYSSFFIEKGLK